MVLTTPDANRTMLSYLGTPAPVVLDARLEAAIARSRLLVIEGYVWEMPGAVASIGAALEVCGCSQHMHCCICTSRGQVHPLCCVGMSAIANQQCLARNNSRLRVHTARWWRSQRATRGWRRESGTSCGARSTPASTCCLPTGGNGLWSHSRSGHCLAAQ
jgi:hypothetical protein